MRGCRARDLFCSACLIIFPIPSVLSHQIGQGLAAFSLLNAGYVAHEVEWLFRDKDVGLLSYHPLFYADAASVVLLFCLRAKSLL